MKNRGKRGLAPVVASVLLILLVLVLASMIFLWARGFVSEQIEKFGEPVDNLCSRISFDAVRVQGSSSSSYDTLEIANRGNVDIYQLEIRKHLGGTIESELFKFSIKSGDSTSKDVNLKMKDNSEPEKIVLYPTLLGSVRGKGSNKVFTCLDQGKTLTL